MTGGVLYIAILRLYESLQVLWIVVIFSTRIEVILWARLLAGLGFCKLLVTSVYISEFCHKSRRGMFSCGGTIGYGVGMLMSFVISGCFGYETMNYIFLSITVVGILILIPLMESPIFLMKKGHEKEAAKSIAFFRGCNKNSREVEEEIMTIKRALNPDIDGLTKKEEILNPETKEAEKISKWLLLRKSSSYTALFIVMVLYLASAFQGPLAVQVYAERLFSEAIPNMSSTLSSALYAAVAILATFFASYLMDTTGRRTLLIYASTGTGMCCMLLGSQIHLQWGPFWMTAVFIYIFIATFCCGSGSVPFVLASEVFLPEVRGILTMACMEWAWICTFGILFIFNYLVAWLGLGPVFYLFAVVGFGNAAFCFFFLPETKEVPIDVIQSLFIKKRTRPDTF